MAVTLTSYPVTVSSGKVRNIFAGFDAVELEFKREDVQIVDVSQAPDNKILISITGNIVSSLNIGEWVYLYAAGSTFIYDNSYQILDVTFSSPNTEITVEGAFIEIASTGYCNYKQNWFLESKLVNPDNNTILNYPQLLQSDGSPEGIVKVNTSMLVDFLRNVIGRKSTQVSRSRADCKVMYREVWREDDTALFTLVDEHPIIIIFSAENVEIEDFVNGFDLPKLWDGYPFYINFLHSLQNEINKRIVVNFDEIDINKANITIDNALANFSPSDFGILRTNFTDNTKVIEDNTRYIKFNALSSDLADYETGDYNDTDYLTINTP